MAQKRNYKKLIRSESMVSFHRNHIRRIPLTTGQNRQGGREGGQCPRGVHDLSKKLHNTGWENERTRRRWSIFFLFFWQICDYFLCTFNQTETHCGRPIYPAANGASNNVGIRSPDSWQSLLALRKFEKGMDAVFFLSLSLSLCLSCRCRKKLQQRPWRPN